jgi:small subunit ribosomal protein S6
MREPECPASERRAESAGDFISLAALEAPLHEYELVVVINPDIAEEDVPAAIERVTGAVTSRGGEVTEVTPWGRRKLAYAIERHTEGNYVLTQLRLDPQRAHELEGGFAISEDLLRHLLIRRDEA